MSDHICFFDDRLCLVVLQGPAELSKLLMHGGHLKSILNSCNGWKDGWMDSIECQINFQVQEYLLR